MGSGMCMREDTTKSSRCEKEGMRSEAVGTGEASNTLYVSGGVPLPMDADGTCWVCAAQDNKLV